MAGYPTNVPPRPLVTSPAQLAEHRRYRQVRFHRCTRVIGTRREPAIVTQPIKTTSEKVVVTFNVAIRSLIARLKCLDPRSVYTQQLLQGAGSVQLTRRSDA